MNRIGIAFAALAAGGMLCAMPASAARGGEAEKLRRLDIMLMVTSLRCRTGRDNFQPEFQRFEAAHLAELNGAAKDLRLGLVSQYGAKGADRALDRISTSMANQYGQGHPWLGCAELKVATRILTNMRGRDALNEAADQLLAPDARGEFAMAGR
ncbi:S-adenosyl-L-homocysteine hydrolase [Novosphingobium flavum]|uniref:S-adenosyl-L-homocysteine hydrolase n=1 Tax=Novosphingobium flavum TaxID=1778672 RepID=A0A7X1FNL3_9SPHN|nr:S-adenosyl-L-homocysteine hydrolase [Novosphingobium flavum]MBC2664130.1 S-adenosyl-L-homocysteine hydrolase [Novosphingobium flavum]